MASHRSTLNKRLPTFLGPSMASLDLPLSKTRQQLRLRVSRTSTDQPFWACSRLRHRTMHHLNNTLTGRPVLATRLGGVFWLSFRGNLERAMDNQYCRDNQLRRTQALARNYLLLTCSSSLDRRSLATHHQVKYPPLPLRLQATQSSPSASSSAARLSSQPTPTTNHQRAQNTRLTAANSNNPALPPPPAPLSAPPTPRQAYRTGAQQAPPTRSASSCRSLASSRARRAAASRRATVAARGPRMRRGRGCRRWRRAVRSGAGVRRRYRRLIRVSCLDICSR